MKMRGSVKMGPETGCVYIELIGFRREVTGGLFGCIKCW